MGFDPITLALAKNYTDEKVGSGGSSGGGLPVIELKDTQPIFGEAVELGEADTEAVNQLARTAIFDGNLLPIVLIADMGGRLAVVCNALLSYDDNNSATLVFIGNTTIGGAAMSVQLYAANPGVPPSILLEIVE